MSRDRLMVIGGYAQRHWRRLGLFGLAGALGLMIVVQLVFPWHKLPLYTVIDGVDVSGWDQRDAVDVLNERYKQTKVALYFGGSLAPYRQPLTGAIGMTIDAQHQIESAMYPWWLRLVPGSLWWAHTVVDPIAPDYTVTTATLKEYIAKELGTSCEVDPVNATLAYKEGGLRVVPARDGGTCRLEDVEKQLANARPTLAKRDVRIAMNERPAVIRDEAAQTRADEITVQTKQGVNVKVESQTVTIPQAEFLSWLEFRAPDTSIVATASLDRSKVFFDKQLVPKVAMAAGTSRVTTLDFTEVSRTDGAVGRTLDSSATIEALNQWLDDADRLPVAKTKSVPPTVVYTRTYTPTDTGMAALLRQFAEARPGTFGVSFAELDGKRRHAGYQETKVFRTASTYKLFVAYGTLKRVEAGTWRWTDMIHGGRNLEKCLDDMIVKSDNPCGETLLAKIGYKAMTNELAAIGLKKSSFVGEIPETTAGDLTTFVGALQSGQLLTPDSTSRLLGAMKRNVYRKGIPAGANGQTADKVGFLDALLHDAAVVSGPTGTYVLSIMSDGSSWATLAELTREIEKLRVQ